jgi:hypothetical protein
VKTACASPSGVGMSRAAATSPYDNVNWTFSPWSATIQTFD